MSPTTTVTISIDALRYAAAFLPPVARINPSDAPLYAEVVALAGEARDVPLAAVADDAPVIVTSIAVIVPVGRKIDAIKAVREISNTDLVEAKAAVEGTKAIVLYRSAGEARALLAREVCGWKGRDLFRVEVR